MTMAIKKTAGIGLKRSNDELKVMQESINLLKGSLTNQITGIKKTITKLLDKETSLAEKIRTLLCIYHFSTVVDFLSKKYSGSSGYRNSWYQKRNLQ